MAWDVLGWDVMRLGRFGAWDVLRLDLLGLGRFKGGTLYGGTFWGWDVFGLGRFVLGRFVGAPRFRGAVLLGLQCTFIFSG